MTVLRELAESNMKSARIHITGIVQGVGFRPFVFNLANQLAITGWVRNTSSGVYIAADGTEPNLEIFIERLRSDKPPLAQIDRIEIELGESSGAASFTIQPSEAIPHAFQPISPDVATCPDCLEEIFDPSGRRYHYAFTNCTNCGPRFTIITDIPYDRPNTTMAGFTMCPQCSREYQDPTDRRFHAQPIACPTCGPQIWFEPNFQADCQADCHQTAGIPLSRLQRLSRDLPRLKRSRSCSFREKSWRSKVLAAFILPATRPILERSASCAGENYASTSRLP